MPPGHRSPLTNSRVPFGLIRQLCYPGGRRLPEFKLIRPETNVIATRKLYTSKPVLLPAPKPSDGSLTNDQYRLFMGKSAGSTGAVCRGCEKELRGADEIKLHTRICKVDVLSAIKLLHRDKKCTVCHTRTLFSKWGVPLCSENCEMVWKVTMPTAFREARRLARANA